MLRMKKLQHTILKTALFFLSTKIKIIIPRGSKMLSLGYISRRAKNVDYTKYLSPGGHGEEVGPRPQVYNVNKIPTIAY